MQNFRYTKSPTAYSDTLRNKGQRAKARAYWEYSYDIECGEENSLRFYAKSWGVSKTTAARWVDDFEEKYSIFIAAMDLYNMQQNKHAKKEGGHNRDSSEEENSPETTCTPQTQEPHGTAGGQQGDKALNKYNNNIRMKEKLFSDLFSIYNMNTDFPGSKDKAREQYLNMHEGVEHKDLIQAAVMYLHDPIREGRLMNLSNFLKNEVYINYLPKYIRVFTKGKWIDGEYDRKNEVFTSADGDKMRVPGEIFTSKFIKGEIKFILEAAA